MGDQKIHLLPEPFNFYRMVLDGDHLHFGLWPQEHPEWSLERAQEEMFDALLTQFPKAPAGVLDVGCGLGVSAYKLARKGFAVTAIAPSQALIDYAAQTYAHLDLDYRVADFLATDDLGGPYDVLLFQESLQYLRPLNAVFEKARTLLKPKGVVILSDEICCHASIRDQTAAHGLKDVIAALSENGFRTKTDRSVGAQVKSTCDHIVARFSENGHRLAAAVPNGAKRLSFFLDGWKSQQYWYERAMMGYHLMAAAKDDIFIRAYQSGDEHMILPLFREVFHNQRSLDHWYWKFRDNPFGQHKIVQALSADGQLAAHYCGYAVVFYAHLEHGPKEFVSYQAGDTMTNPKFRMSGLGATSVLSRTVSYFYQKFCTDQVPYIYGFNTGNIRKFGERFLQYVYTDRIPYHVLAIDGRHRNAAARFKGMLSGFSVKPVSRLSASYDRFFDTVCHDYKILVKRDARYLTWRYLDCPDRIHRLFALKRFGTLVGWGVFAQKKDVLLWGDALFDKRYRDRIAWFLSQVVQTYQGVNRIEAWFSPVPRWWSEALGKAGFTATEEPNGLAPTFKIFDPEFSTGLFAESHYYTMGDSDLF